MRRNNQDQSKGKGKRGWLMQLEGRKGRIKEEQVEK